MPQRTDGFGTLIAARAGSFSTLSVIGILKPVAESSPQSPPKLPGEALREFARKEPSGRTLPAPTSRNPRSSAALFSNETTTIDSSSFTLSQRVVAS